MVRVAAIYDIHANLPALLAVLKEVLEAGVDSVVIGGDVVPGPMPQETLSCLRDLDVPVQFIHGNGEVAVLAEMTGTDSGYNLPQQVQQVVRWNAQQIRQHEGWLASWPRTVRLEVEGLGEVLFCHGTPRDENEIFTSSTPEESLGPVFDELDASTVVCGHTHMQFDRIVAKTRIVNAGSVGMPFGEPGADWLLVGPEVELRHTSYDLATAAERIRDSDSPDASQYAQDILTPRSAAQMRELFKKAETRPPG